MTDLETELLHELRRHNEVTEASLKDISLKLDKLVCLEEKLDSIHEVLCEVDVKINANVKIDSEKSVSNGELKTQKLQLIRDGASWLGKKIEAPLGNLIMAITAFLIYRFFTIT